MRLHLLRLCVVALAGVVLACGKSDVSKYKQRSKPDASVAPKERPRSSVRTAYVIVQRTVAVHCTNVKASDMGAR